MTLGAERLHGAAAPRAGRHRHAVEVADEELAARVLEVARVDGRLVATAVAGDVLLLHGLDQQHRVGVRDRDPLDAQVGVHRESPVVSRRCGGCQDRDSSDSVVRTHRSIAREVPSMTDALKIPAELLPADGRFGAGPSKIQTSHLDALAATGDTLMGTSHRQAPVKQTVGRVREGLAALFDLPDGYEVVLGNGGATAFWDIACFGLIREKSQHLAFGEFSSKFATSAKKAPWLADPTRHLQRPGLAARGRRRGRRRRLRLGAQRDLDRGHGARTPPGGRRRRRARARRRDLRRRRPAGRPPRGRHLLLRAAEVLRLRRRALGRPDVAARPRARRGDRRRPTATSRRSSTCRPRSTTPRRTRPTTPRRSRRSS